MKKFAAIALAAFALTSCSIYDAREERAPRTEVPVTTIAPTTTVAPVVVGASMKPTPKIVPPSGTKVAKVAPSTTAAPTTTESAPIVVAAPQPAPVPTPQPAPTQPPAPATTQPPVVLELPDNSCIAGAGSFNPACPQYGTQP